MCITMDSSRRGFKRDMSSTGSDFPIKKKFRGENINSKTNGKNSDDIITENNDQIELNMSDNKVDHYLGKKNTQASLTLDHELLSTPKHSFHNIYTESDNETSFINPCRTLDNFFEIDEIFNTNNNIWEEDASSRNSCYIINELKNNSVKCEMECNRTIDLESSDKRIYNIDDELAMNVPMQERCSTSSSINTTNLSLSAVECNENGEKINTCIDNIGKFSGSRHSRHQNFDSERTDGQNECLYEDQESRSLSSHISNVDYGIILKQSNRKIEIKNEPREIVGIHCNNDSQEENVFITKIVDNGSNDNFQNFSSCVPNNFEKENHYLTSEGNLENEIDYFLHRANFKSKSDRCNAIESNDQTKSNMIYNKSLVQCNLKEAFSALSPNTSPISSIDDEKNINSKNYHISNEPSYLNRFENSTNNIFYQNSNLDDSIKSCLKGWKIKYPWVNFNEKSFTLDCMICSQSLKHYEVCTIKCSVDIYKVATNLLIHSVTERHLLLHFIYDYTKLQRVFAILKYCLQNNISKHVLLSKINYIVKLSTGSATVSNLTIILLIKIISSVVNDHILNTLKRNKGFGITFLIDPCKKILIARFLRGQRCPEEPFPEEIVVTDYANSPFSSLNEYIAKNDLFKNENRNINFVRNMYCSKCPQGKPVEIFENIPPPRFPSIEVFHKYILFNEYIQSYYKFVYYLSLTIKKNYHIFQHINEILLVTKLKWFNVKLFHFLSNNINAILSILINLSTCSNYAKLCIDNRAALSQLSFYFIDLISSITDHYYYSGFINDESVKKGIISKTNFVSKMMRNENKENSPYVITLKIIELFINECLDKTYYTGKDNLRDFHFFFLSNRLACVGTIYSTEFEERAIYKSYLFFKKHFNINYEKFLCSLRSFGEYLYNNGFRGKLLTMLEILKLFNDHQI